MRTQHKNTFNSRALLLVTLIAAPNAFAANWQTGAAIATGGVYSDNVCLEEDNLESKFIATVTPELSITAQGARASMELVGGLEFNSIANSSLDCSAAGLGDNKDSPSPRLRFNGNSELLKDWLYFDASAYADQNKVNAFAAGGNENLDGRRNTNTTYNYNLSPYISHKLGDVVNVLLRYTFDDQRNTVDVVGDSTSNSALFDIGSDPSKTRFSLGVSGNYSEIEYDERAGGRDAFNNELSSVRVRTSYQLNSQWQVNAYAGEEWNDFLSVDDEIEGTLWDVGLLWTPSKRISFAVGVGDRFFGIAPRFDVSYRHKRSELRASYQRDITYDRNVRTVDQSTLNIDQLVAQAIEQVLAGEPITLSGTPTTITNSPIVNEQFVLSYSYKGRRTTINLNGGRSEQKRAQDGRDSTFSNISLSARRNLSRTLALESSVSWSDRQTVDFQSSVLQRDSETWRAGIGIDKELGVHTNVMLNYQYSQRNSELVIDEYDENRLTLTLRYQF
jgi:uncharacterized protein (PEP-CTERM system associated)